MSIYGRYNARTSVVMFRAGARCNIKVPIIAMAAFKYVVLR
jgi:hypothetical protein